MDDRFFRPHWSHPSVMRSRYTPSARGIPVHSVQPPVQQQQYKPPAKTAPKVVQIPVQFVGSEPEPSRSPSGSALKIQKVFRGFLVRRSVKKIVAIKREVEEIERRISRSETVELIRTDQRERLRVNEMLMALLFKLDSVRGVDSGVRDCRRAVIKKAIALQERVDAIVSSANNDQNITETRGELKEDDKQFGQTLESNGSAEEKLGELGNQSQDSASEKSSEEKITGEELQGFDDEPVEEAEFVENVAESCEKVKVGGDLEVVEECDEEKVVKICDDKVNVDADSCIENGISENLLKDDWAEVGADEGERAKDEETCGDEAEESVETNRMENLTEGGEVNDVAEKSMEEVEGEEKEGRDDSKRNRELLERMMEDNGKMINLMTQLFERNEAQTRMLNALTHRVEMLEKAFVCDRMRRKKRHCA